MRCLRTGGASCPRRTTTRSSSGGCRSPERRVVAKEILLAVLYCLPGVEVPPSTPSARFGMTYVSRRGVLSLSYNLSAPHAAAAQYIRQPTSLLLERVQAQRREDRPAKSGRQDEEGDEEGAREEELALLGRGQRRQRLCGHRMSGVFALDGAEPDSLVDFHTGFAP